MDCSHHTGSRELPTTALQATPVNVANIDEYTTCFAWQAPTDVVGRV